MDLRDIPLFESLTEKEFKIVKSKLKKVTYSAGDVIIKEGDIGNEMYIFESGKVKITRKLTLRVGGKWGEAEKAMDILNSEQVSFFGEMSIVTGAPRSATITALSYCTLYTLSKKDLEDLAKRYPEIGYKIMKKVAAVLAKRVQKLNNTVLKLTTALSIVVSSK